MIFQVKNGSFGYGREDILSGISFEIGRDSIMSVLGSNGAGKTTLLKCMLGLLPWKKGESVIDGAPITRMKYREIWQRIGYVPQAKLSAFAYTVEEMVLLGRNAHLKMLEQPGERDMEIARDCLGSIGILHLKDKLCSQISGGELQMVLIARALASEPSLLVLDEPESNLDFKNQLIVLDTIKRLCRERHISSIVNTHYPEHAIAISDKTLILNRDGTSVYGETHETITEPNLKKAFGVNVRIRDVMLPDCQYTCVLPVSLA